MKSNASLMPPPSFWVEHIDTEHFSIKSILKALKTFFNTHIWGIIFFQQLPVIKCFHLQIYQREIAQFLLVQYHLNTLLLENE